MRVRAKCSAKGCTLLILCSWCSAKRLFIIKYYVAEHSCLLKATRNRRVTANVVVEKFGDMIAAMPILKPRHLKALIRMELGVFISDKVCKNDRCLVL